MSQKRITPQGEIIPFDSERWVAIGICEHEQYIGSPSIRLGIKANNEPLGFSAMMLNDMSFHNGIIEYDIAFDKKQMYPGIDFRQQGNNSERFYLRAHQSGEPDANSYIPMFNGIQSWQLYCGESFSSPTKYQFGQWQHVKIVKKQRLRARNAR